MTLTLELKPETEVGLVPLAEACGLTLEAYILRMVDTAARPLHRLGPAERAAAWVETAARFPETPPLPDEAISRESIYGDRG